MIVTHTPADGTIEQVSTLDLSAIESAEIEEVLGGVAWRAIEDQLRQQNPTAMRAVLWAVRKRAAPDLAFASVDVPKWKMRLKARLERHEIDEILTNIMSEALAKSEDAAIDAMLPHFRKLAHDQGDIEPALDALGKGHLVPGRQASGD
ncbi:hypothetical protein [Streptomyces sp. NPDC058665]|uniref:hypothetical protein n=1 Tax=Streptomyces sp. NPDC058665 TaxID=3346586 RepID=UPI00364AC74D